MSFRARLFIYFGGLLALVLSSSLWTLDRRETRRAEAEVESGLRAAHDLLGRLLKERERQLATSVQLLSGDFAFKQAVATGEAATVLSAARNHRRRVGADLLLVADAEGAALADTRRRIAAGAAIARLPGVPDALSGRAAYGLGVLDGLGFQFASVPVNAPDLIGILLAGFALEDTLAAELKRLSRADVVIAAAGRITASTLTRGRRDDLQGALARLPAGQPAIVSLRGERFLALRAPLGPGVETVTLRSWDEALEPLRAARNALLAIGLCGLLLTAAAGLLIAAGVTRDLRRLTAAAGQISRGHYELKIELHSRDEIGRLGEAFSAMARGLIEREKIRSVLRKAVSKEIAEALLAKGQIELGGEEREVTVLFSDIRSFTTASESLRPQELVAQLNEYFTAMARAIDAHHGVIDKFIGDAIMALFGAPLRSDNDAASALRAGLAMFAALDGLNAARAKAGRPPWSNGIGINTGVAVAGTLGSEDRWSYTVIGDAVNLASRLEGLTKHYGARLIASDTARRAAGKGFAYRTLDRVVVKGRREPVEIFEVLGEGGAPEWLADYEQGVGHCRAGRAAQAEAAFKAVLGRRPDDGPSRRYLARIERLRAEPAPAWDAATQMHEK